MHPKCACRCPWGPESVESFQVAVIGVYELQHMGAEN